MTIPRRDLSLALSLKYGVPLRTVRRHMRIFTAPISESARLCVINEIKRRYLKGKGGYDN